MSKSKCSPEATTVAAALYARVSTSEQAEEGYSLGAQEKLAFERATDDGATIAREHVYVDAGISGDKAARPRYQAMLAAAAAGEFTCLYVWRLDRLNRDAEEALRARRMLGAAGVRLVSITEGEDESTLVYGVRALIAQDEREKIAARTKLGLRQVAESGRQPCGQPPLGYHVEGERRERRWVIARAEATTVRRIFELYLGGMGVNRVCRTLNEDGARTRRGAKFSPRVILDLLDNPAYVGLIRLKEETFPGTHTPLLDEATWQAVQQLRVARKTHSGGKGRPPARHLLVPLLRCVNGHRMLARTNTNGWEHYRCQRRHGYGDCDAPSVSRRAVDEAMLRSFTTENVDHAATKAALIEAATVEADNARALAEAASTEPGKAEMRLERIRRDYVESKLSAEQWNDLRSELEDEAEAAEAESERLQAQAEQADAALAAIDAEQELVERLAAVREVVSGKIESAEGVAAVRAALIATFERIVVGRMDDAWEVEELPPGSPMLTTKSGLLLVPVPRPELLQATRVPVRTEDGSLAEIELQRPPKVSLRTPGEMESERASTLFIAAGRHESHTVVPVSAALLAVLFPAIPITTGGD